MDSVIKKIVEYVTNYTVESKVAYQTAHYDIIDTLGCGMLALTVPACTQLLGPVVPEASVTEGVRVPGTSYRLDPVTAAFNMGCLNRWLDFNDTWLAQEWGHPSDNLAAILAVADYVSLRNQKKGQAPLTLKQVAEALIKAHEIQGVLALENSFNRVGLDHVILVKVASTAVCAHLLGLSPEVIAHSLSQAWVDGQSLRTYRHFPNTGSRKSWAAGDAAARGVWLALLSQRGEMGYQTPITAKDWGFQDVLYGGKQVKLEQELGCYVMENILFKISFPAEFHGQTAVECAVQCHPHVISKLDQIEKITLFTQESAVRIIDKKGALKNPADRDHCIQYMTAVGLLYGNLEPFHYENDFKGLPEVDKLREKMEVIEDKQYSLDYLDPQKRSIANALEISFKDGTKLNRVSQEYPVGHQRRRKEGIPLLLKKFDSHVDKIYTTKTAEQIQRIFKEDNLFMNLPVTEFMDLLVTGVKPTFQVT